MGHAKNQSRDDYERDPRFYGELALSLTYVYIVVLKKHALPNFPTVRPVDMWRVLPTMCYGRNAVRTILFI